jgi:hypothetical protein
LIVRVRKSFGQKTSRIRAKPAREDNDKTKVGGEKSTV